MKLYNAGAPNPRRVRIFLAEKGIEVPLVNVDIQGGASRTPEFLKLNSLGETPVLELDDGRIITESVAICRYFEAIHPQPALFGGDAVEQAQVEMWNRRMEIQLMGTVGDVARHTFEFFASRIRQLPDYAAAQRAAVPQKWAWLDTELADGRPFVAGKRFSVADITGMTALLIGDFLEIPVPADLQNVGRWAAAVRGRPSWDA